MALEQVGPFPTEVWEHVFNYVDGKTIAGLRRVCRLFRDIINRPEFQAIIAIGILNKAQCVFSGDWPSGLEGKILAAPRTAGFADEVYRLLDRTNEAIQDPCALARLAAVYFQGGDVQNAEKLFDDSIELAFEFARRSLIGDLDLHDQFSIAFDLVKTCTQIGRILLRVGYVQEAGELPFLIIDNLNKIFNSFVCVGILGNPTPVGEMLELFDVEAPINELQIPNQGSAILFWHVMQCVENKDYDKALEIWGQITNRDYRDEAWLWIATTNHIDIEWFRNDRDCGYICAQLVKNGHHQYIQYITDPKYREEAIFSRSLQCADRGNPWAAIAGACQLQEENWCTKVLLAAMRERAKLGASRKIIADELLELSKNIKPLVLTRVQEGLSHAIAIGRADSLLMEIQDE